MSRPRARLIYNPSSGREAMRQILPDVLDIWENSGLEVSCHRTRPGEDAIHAAKQAVLDGFDYVIAAGGDGTVNQVINGLASAPADQRPIIGILPAGTTNDLARALGLPRDLMKAAEVIARRDQLMPLDIGMTTVTQEPPDTAHHHHKRVTRSQQGAKNIHQMNHEPSVHTSDVGYLSQSTESPDGRPDAAERSLTAKTVLATKSIEWAKMSQSEMELPESITKAGLPQTNEEFSTENFNGDANIADPETFESRVNKQIDTQLDQRLDAYFNAKEKKLQEPLQVIDLIDQADQAFVEGEEIALKAEIAKQREETFTPKGESTALTEEASASPEAAAQIETNMESKQIVFDPENTKFFVNIAGCGRITEITYEVPSRQKTILGGLAYYFKGLEKLPQLKPISLSLESEEYNFSGKAMLCLIANSNSVGGFEKLAPKARPSDGLMDVILVKAVTIPEMIRLAALALRGEHIYSDRIVYFQTKSVRLTSRDTVEINLDGEHGGQLPRVFQVLASHLQVLV